MPLSDSPYKSFHETLTNELLAIKDRFRSLVRYRRNATDDEETESLKSHWLTDGEWKESALRTVLKRHLTTPIGRGFVVGVEDSTTQIDILIPKPNRPFVFQDGDLFVLTADSVDVIIEVKTSLDGQAIGEAIMKLARIGEFCRNSMNVSDDETPSSPWLGLFVYDEGNGASMGNVMRAIGSAYEETKVVVNCVSFGIDHFVRFWERGEWEKGDDDTERAAAMWKSYRLDKVAPSYFIGNVVDAACSVDNQKSDYAWFSYADGKRAGGYLIDKLFVTDVVDEDRGHR